MSSENQTCPACGHVIQSGALKSCPRCGGIIRQKINWFLFFGCLLAPAIFSALGAFGKLDGLAIGSVLFGSLVAGIICGIHLGMRVGRTSGAQVGLSFAFIFVFGAVSFVLGFFGCMAGGFTMDFH